ncbi:MAG: hypothetical protein IJ087_09900 [Eggerthellaceae bacterium]|nr:hypothetical protein [Eggerthellaceae bacterium]
MESIEKLRDYANEHIINGPLMNAMVDGIEREIAERYMELPVDADGVPIRVGDYLQLGESRGEVVALTYCPSNGKLPWEWQCDTGDWYNTAFARHAKPRTLEDVLRDVVTLCANMWKDEKSAFRYYDVGNVMESGNIADFAAEIRDLLGGDTE